MSRKYILSVRYPFVRPYEPDLSLKIDELRRENKELRAKLVAAQDQRVRAEQAADRLRAEKERLREKANALRQEIASQEMKSIRLADRIGELQELIERSDG
jgi:hypothetical protein